MKKKRTLTVVAVLLAVLMLGVGYAMISEISLTITDTSSAIASPDDSQFEVKFTEAVKTSAPAYATVSQTIDASDPTKGTISISGLKAKGDTVVVTYTILNNSADLAANLVTAVNNDAEGYDKTNFRVTSVLGAGKIEHSATTTLAITVELLTTPISGDLTTKIPVSVTATATTPAA
ncbi:MAG: hypothetical protein J6A17_04890 [Bacilli bacterium]|nr:hypothetical protein [Bacilli bacterium]